MTSNAKPMGLVTELLKGRNRTAAKVVKLYLSAHIFKQYG